jgi:hypothetical protein
MKRERKVFDYDKQNIFVVIYDRHSVIVFVDLTSQDINILHIRSNIIIKRTHTKIAHCRKISKI